MLLEVDALKVAELDEQSEQLRALAGPRQDQLPEGGDGERAVHLVQTRLAQNLQRPGGEEGCLEEDAVEEADERK